MIANTKEVNFDKYCVKCKNFEERDDVGVCNECLYNPFMINSHVPMRFVEEKDKKKLRKNQLTLKKRQELPV